MDFDRLSSKNSTVAIARERLRALDGTPVNVSILRAPGLHGEAVIRAGTLRALSAKERRLPIVGAVTDRPIGCVDDDGGFAIATLLETDTFDIDFGPLRAILRPSFRIDVAADPFPIPPERLPDFHAATRDIAAELEAGFRTALIVRPDPDPSAGIRADRGLPPVDTGPLSDGSVRFAIGHSSARLVPEGKGSIALVCTETVVREIEQVAERYVPQRGGTYALLPSEIRQLTSDIRAFLNGRREGFARTR